MKNYLVQKVYGEDRLSDLHDDIIIHIQSFLDVKSAAQTCVLSKRWNNKLWIHHQDVYLNGETFGETSLEFEEFVDMVLAQRDKLHHKIGSFSFTWTFNSSIPQELLHKVHAHAQYHDVRHFDLSINWDSGHHSYFSQNFSSKSLTTLRLNLSNVYQPSFCTHMSYHVLRLYLSGCTALKTLCLENIWIEDSSGDVDLFPSLVDLTELHIISCVIEGDSGPLLVRAPRLERLTILQNVCCYWDYHVTSRVLKYLRTDFRLSRHTINQLPRYIEELEIDFWWSSTNYKTTDHAQWLIYKIRCLPHAKSVTLSKSTLQVISAFPEVFETTAPVTLPQFKWEFLKVITTNELPTEEFPEYHPGLAALTKNCSKTLKVEFV